MRPLKYHNQGVQPATCAALVPRLTWLLPAGLPGAPPIAGPMPPPGAPPPIPGGADEAPMPDAKRARTEFVLEDGDEFLERHPGMSKVVPAPACAPCMLPVLVPA